jgi:ribosome-associated translation inhibitor RaiA
MKNTILTTDITLDEKIDNYLKDKLGSIEKLIDEKDSSVLAEIELERTTRHHHKGRIFRAEINLRTAQFGQKRSEGLGETLEQAIDEMKADILQQLRVAKGKRITKNRKGARKVKMNIL